ncbi:MAG: OmpH family outer membrane protein [Alphaproteobacteria bacterium]|nr:OmpH family outer membrane protein [Alphaproteobacteria bacterium]
MARWTKAACAALLVGLMAGTVNAAVAKAPEAAASGSPVIAVLDVQLVLRNAVAVKGIRTAIDARRKGFEDEIELVRKDLKAEEQKLRQQSTILSPEAANERRRVLETKFSDLRRKAEQRRGILERAFVGATRKLRNEIAKVLTQLMAEQKITITLARTAVLVFDERLNVTSEVLKRLDKNLPNVTVEFKKPDEK